MRIKAQSTSELNEQLRSHPAVASIVERDRQAKGEAGALSRSEVRQLLGQAQSSDPRLGELVRGMRRVAKCRQEGRELLKDSLAAKRPGASRAYAKKWAGIGGEYRSIATLSYDLLASNTTMAAVAQATKDVEDVHRFANPVFLDPAHRLVLEELGIDVGPLADQYRFAYLPERAELDRVIAGTGMGLPTKGRQHINDSAFLYAPEHLLSDGVVALAGSDLAALQVAMIGAAAAYAAVLAETERLAAAMRAAELSWLVFIVLWWIWMDRQAFLASIQTHSQQLQQQYDEELQALGMTNGPSTGGETPSSVAAEFGYVVGNMSRSKREVHLPSCSFLSLARPDHLRTLPTLAAAQGAGLDNCHFCIGGSTR